MADKTKCWRVAWLAGGRRAGHRDAHIFYADTAAEAAQKCKDQFNTVAEILSVREIAEPDQLPLKWDTEPA